MTSRLCYGEYMEASTTKIQPWGVSDEFWEQVEPLIPERKREAGRVFMRKPGGGRKPMVNRRVFEGILFVLKTGCQWKALPRERFGSGSSVHKYFRQWLEAGFFLALWRAGLAEYHEMEGITWKWGDTDTAGTPPALDTVGPSLKDRDKRRKRGAPAGKRPWRPAVVDRYRGKSS